MTATSSPHGTVLDAAAVERTLRRMAGEIAEDLGDETGAVFLGIRSGGVPLARRLARLVAAAESRPAAPVGELDITLYRDDLYTGLEKPILGPTRVPVAIDGVGVVLVDDVLFTGRTVRAALDELMDFGRPRWIRLAVLVDRGHRELPIQADYVGRKVPTALSDRVRVLADGVDPSPLDRVEVLPAGKAP